MRLVFVFSLLIFVADPAAAVFKCVSQDGRTSFQEQPCADGEGTRFKLHTESPRSGAIDTALAPQLGEDELKARVRAALKDPDSAVFKDVRHVGGGRALCGQVNAKNSYGGYSGFRLFVADSEGVYWAGDGSSQVDVGRYGARRTYVPRAVAWGCL